MNAKVQNLLHASREQDGDAARLQDVIALMGQSGGFGRMIIPRHQQHATTGGRARRIGMLEHVTAAVHARTLAIPHAKHTVVFGSWK